MFNVSWLSDYTAESERLFIGGYKRLTIESIINVSTANNYSFYLKAMNNLNDLIQGFENEYPFDNQTRSIFKKLIFHQESVFKSKYGKELKKIELENKFNGDNNNYSDDEEEYDESKYMNAPFTNDMLVKWSLSVPDYIKYLFQNWCSHAHQQMVINIGRINQDDSNGSYKRIKYLFITPDNTWCRLDRLCTLFNNLKCLII